MEKARRPLVCLGLLGLALVLLACGSGRRGEPLIGPIAFSPQAQRGEVIFMRLCQQCHPGGEAGLAPALNNKPLPGFVIDFQVRRGLGAMPAFPEHEISEPSLDAVEAYLIELRRAGW